MKVVDLTHVIESTMPVYPGTQPPTFEPANTYEKDGFSVQRLCMLQKGVGENGLRFAEEWKSSPVVHTRSFSLLYFVCSKSQSLTASIL